MCLKQLLCYCFFFVFIFKINAQVYQSHQKKYLKVNSDTLFLDSLSILPESLQINCIPKNDSAAYPEFNSEKHCLVFKKTKPDSVMISYQRLPLNLNKLYFHKNANDLYNDYSRRANPFSISFNNNTNNDNLFLNDGLNKNGNISRGISFGNNQDVVVNSNLNLQVNGKLTPEINLVLAATDNNIPFQPDGTTAQLQEFDKVFVQLNNQSTKMVVGDFQLSRPSNSYFMNFYKRAQGVFFENNFIDSASKNKTKFKTQVSAAVSRGKFSRQIFFGIESNQGPYRLKGANNETFIIILSGTEKIYIDGKLLLRGQENDYIVDYNTGEITFTAKQLITKDKRIIAEFQYAERNYARSLFFLSEEIEEKKTRVNFNFYNEQDNKNKSLQQSLSDAQKITLNQIGDTLEKAYSTGVERNVVYNNSDVFYLQKDTFVNFSQYKLFEQTNKSDLANYRIRFSNVGANRGNYNQVSSSSNGKVYQWIAPINGIKQGIYDTVIPLVTPKLNQMLTMALTQSITQNNLLSIEGVYTRNDINTLSSFNKRNDEGSGVKVISKNQKVFRQDSLKQEHKVFFNLNYEFLQKQFTQVERFRSVEFDRDWNRTLTGVLNNDQHVGNAEIGITKFNQIGATYNANIFEEGKNFEGVRQNVNTFLNKKFFKMNYNASYLSSTDKQLALKTKFFRHASNASTNIGKAKLSYTDVFENNLFLNSKTDSLAAKAYQFWEWEASIANADSGKSNVKLFYKERRDKLNYSNDLKDSTIAQNIGMRANFNQVKNNPVTIFVTQRELFLTKNIASAFLKPDNTLLGRIEYSPKYFKGLITSNLFYETGYGLENRKEFYYLEVVPGQGQYAWKDYNNNNIKELNEFEVALFADQARFIRIYTPTNQYQKVLQNQFSFSTNIRANSKMRGSKNEFIKFISRWALQTAIKVDNKITEDKGKYNYNPFAVLNDSLLIANNNNLRQSIFFNQSSAVFSADYTFIKNQNKQLLINGIDERFLQTHEVHTRINFLKIWAINVNATASLKENTSKFFSSRNYKINTQEIESKLILQPNTNFRLSGNYKYSQKINNAASALQTAFINTIGLDFKYSKSEKGSLNAKVDYIKILYNAEQNSSAAYEMLSGLNNGDNYTWDVNYQRNLNSNLQVSINYNGRKTTGSNVVHLGGMQIRAYF